MSGQTDYPLDKSIGRPYGVLSSVAPYKLTMMSRYNLDRFDPKRTMTGDPKIAAISDMAPVSTQPGSAAVITVVSSSTDDVTQKVLVKGIVSGQEDYEQVSLNGTTSASTTKSFSSITSITKSATTSGRVTVTSGATTVVVLGPLDKTVNLRVMSLYPIPQSVLTITVRHFDRAPFLTHAYEGLGPLDDWDYVVDQWAFLLALQSKGQDQSAEFNNQVLLGTKMLDEDMASEEGDSSDDPILIDDAGRPGSPLEALWVPSGHGIMEG